MKCWFDFCLVFKVTDCLTTVKSINKTDAITLLSTFSVSTPEKSNSFSPLAAPYRKKFVLRLMRYYNIIGQFEDVLWINCLILVLVWFSDVSRGNGPVQSINWDYEFVLFFFQSVKGIISASKEDLVLCPGLGPQKVRKNTCSPYEYLEKVDGLRKKTICW